MTTKIEPKEVFFDLPFEDNKKITDKQLKDAYDAGHYFIRIILTDAHFSPEITLFDDDGLEPILGGVVYIENRSTKVPLVASGPDKEPEPVRPNYYYSASGNKLTGWMINVNPIEND